MARQILTERTIDFGNFRSRAQAGVNAFVPVFLSHIYVKLEFQSKYENAQNAEDAKGFFRSVTRATTAADLIARMYGGDVLEVQGSMLHIGIPVTRPQLDTKSFMGSLHVALNGLFNRAGSRVDGWRMSCDTGRTLVVAGRGVHGDSSFVSLGKSANRPAKHIYSQLELPEASRSLKRGHYAEWDIRANVWRHGHLDELQPRLVEAQRASSEATRLDPRVSFIRAASPSSRGLGDIAPVGRDPVNPEAPQTYFGWVMRADLDGFTSRVETCFDNDAALTNLAVEFFTLMDMAATFVEAHKETLAQLPWAGDNFTAAAVYASKYEYDRAAPRRLVELALDFEKELAARAKTAGFGGWAYGVAGGEVHGNTSGNVYIATAEANGRRFLIGTGEGFGRSAQAFGDINPRAGTMALYEVDYTRLDESYQDEFVHAQTVRGEQSSLFRKAQMSQLQTERARRATIGKPTTVSVPGRAPVPVSTRPYFA